MHTTIRNLGAICAVAVSLLTSCAEPGPTPMSLKGGLTVNGEPVLGGYAVLSMAGLRVAHETGMNVVLGRDTFLDTTTEEGRYCFDNDIKVMHHLTGQLYGRPRLRTALTPGQTSIPLRRERFRPLPEPGVVQLDEELIRYTSWNDSALVGCERGYDATRASTHRAGTILFWPEECAAEIEHARDSPNLWGYYILDDSPGDALSALRGIYRAVKRLDPDQPVIAGYGSAGSLTNFDTGVCDAMVLYWYPVSDAGYDSAMTSHQVQWMLGEARRRVPGIPFVGVYQSFNGGSTADAVPTPEQLREQIEDFVREGASGLISFCMCDGLDGMGGLAGNQVLQEAVAAVHGEIRRTVSLNVRPEPEWMRANRVQPKGQWETPREMPGVVPAWHLLGPFDEDAVPDVPPAAVPGDEDVAAYDGKYGPVRWTRYRTQGGVIGLGEIHGGGHVPAITTLARATVISPYEQEVLALIGTDDDGAIALNGTQVYSFEGSRGLKRDEDSVAVVLAEGRTEMLLRLHNREGMSGFIVRFARLDGSPLDNVEFSPDGT